MAAKKGNEYAKGNPGGGRKSDYKEEYARIAYSMCLLGAIDTQIADAFDVSESTINTWKKKHKEFSLALKEGKIQADAQVASALFHRALGYSHPEDKIFNNDGEALIVPTIKHYPPDPTSCIFWLKNRQPELWRDKPDDDGGNDAFERYLQITQKLQNGNS